jgi:diguanylate cyclase (GGDEF)-like protein
MQAETRRIAVVSHDPVFFAQVEKALGERPGGPFALGPSGRGLERLRELPVQQLLLLDGRESPDNENCYEKLRRLVALGRGPVGLVLGQAHDLAREVARSLGAVGVLGTPIERAALLALVPLKAPFGSAPARPANVRTSESLARTDELKLPAALLAELAQQDPRHDRLLGALIDPETSLYNYEFLTFKLDEEFKRARRFGQPLACVMLGFDGECADGVLRRLSSVFLDASRDTDILGRFDRSTFLFLLPNTDEAGARAMVARVQKSITGLALRDLVGEALELSVGLSQWPDAGVQQASDLYRRSLAALKHSSHAGDRR